MRIYAILANLFMKENLLFIKLLLSNPIVNVYFFTLFGGHTNNLFSLFSSTTSFIYPSTKKSSPFFQLYPNHWFIIFLILESNIFPSNDLVKIPIIYLSYIPFTTSYISIDQIIILFFNYVQIVNSYLTT